MSMEDCANSLNEFIRYNRREVLQGKGTRSKQQAHNKAKTEFDKYRKIQDKTYLNDFEKHLGHWQKPSQQINLAQGCRPYARGAKIQPR